MNETDAPKDFLALAMKEIAGRATPEESLILKQLIVAQPDLAEDLGRVRSDVQIAKEALMLLNATDVTGGEFPEYALERLQTKVRQTFPKRKANDGFRRSTSTVLSPARMYCVRRQANDGFRWWLVLGVGAFAALAVFIGMQFHWEKEAHGLVSHYKADAVLPNAPLVSKAIPPPSLAAAQKLAAENRPTDALNLLRQLPPTERGSTEAQALEKVLSAAEKGTDK